MKVAAIQNYLSRNILKLAERGLWKDRFPESCIHFEKNLLETPQTVYSGFDPTADSLHIGNLLVLTSLLHFQRSGHNVIALESNLVHFVPFELTTHIIPGLKLWLRNLNDIGGATGAIGDPSGKASERILLDEETLSANTKKISKVIERIFFNHEQFIWKSSKKNDSLKPIKILNNLDWYEDISLVKFLRRAGRLLPMGALLKRSAVETRLQKSKSFNFSEFSYQVMQAYDWLHLYKKFNCTIQVGGSDQMGNIVSGHDLISRSQNVQVTGLTVPLITSKEGDKYGKSEGNAIWLSPEKTSPFDFYQFFVRTEDSEVERLLTLFTFINLSEIETLMNLHKEKPNERIPQKKLAEKITLLVHGEEGLLRARRCTEILYGGNSSLLVDVPREDVISLFKGSSVCSLILESGMTILDLALKAKCFTIDWKAIETIEAGGLYINEARVTHPQLALLPGIHILPNKLTLLRVGKKNYYIVKWQM